MFSNTNTIIIIIIIISSSSSRRRSSSSISIIIIMMFEHGRGEVAMSGCSGEKSGCAGTNIIIV